MLVQLLNLSKSKVNQPGDLFVVVVVFFFHEVLDEVVLHEIVLPFFLRPSWIIRKRESFPLFTHD